MIVADTHAWVWWVGARKLLSRPALRALDAEESIGVCAISCWEVAMLVAKGRLELDRDVANWIAQALALPTVQLLELTPEVAVESTRLADWKHEDPADRMIVATALAHHARVVTKDRRISSYAPARALW